MVKFHFSIIACVVIATILGLFGQDIAYVMNEKILSFIHLSYYLTVCTILSIGLYLISVVIVYVADKKKKISRIVYSKYMIIVIIIGLFISCWSLFVFAMWWS